LYRRLIVFRFTQNLGVLLSNKVDLIKSFEIVKKIVGNVIIEEKIEEAAKKIREGASVSNSLSKSEFLPKLVLGMISAGEASDNLDTMLANIGNVYETELDLTVTSLTSLIEPIIIIVMGLVIALIVMSVILPITQMNLLLQ
ncbi:MAG TPA: type II secretion system F family protein, partial [Spirochaetota bacterium]|nr:type II secretion system F family protein [Spirochaetota bacterium]